MPFYNDLRPDADYETRDFALVFPNMMTDAAKVRAIDGVLALKSALDERIPSRRSESNLLVASWNLKELGHTTQRLPEAYFYSAEVISRFDVVAVTWPADQPRPHIEHFQNAFDAVDLGQMF